MIVIMPQPSFPAARSTTEHKFKKKKIATINTDLSKVINGAEIFLSIKVQLARIEEVH